MIFEYGGSLREGAQMRYNQADPDEKREGIRMYVQKVVSPGPGPLRGIAVVLLLMGALFLDLYLTRILALLLPDVLCACLFWLIGIGIALWTLRRYALGYTYAMDDKLLRVSYAYGRRERLMADLWFNNVCAFGPVGEVRARFPDCRVFSAVRPDCPWEKAAVACRDGGRIVIYILQPDTAVRQRLERSVPAKKR